MLRAGIVYRWLESEDTYRVPDAVDFLLGQPDDGIIHGLKLPESVLKQIYRENLRGHIGAVPQPLVIDKAMDYCNELSRIAEAMSGKPAVETEAAQVASWLSGK